MKSFFVLVILLFVIPTQNVYATELPELEGEYKFNETAREIVSGEFSLNPTKICKSICDIFLKQISQSRETVIVLIVIAAMSGVLTIMQGAFKSGGVNDAAFLACFTLSSSAAVKCLLSALECAKEIIKLMSEFITKLSPLLITAILSSGAPSSAAAFKPVLSGAVYIITVTVDKCLIPLILFGAVLSIVNNISGRVQISSYTKLVQSVVKWILTAVLTMFTGITGIYGFSAPMLDALGARAAKFAVGSFVPVVGGLLSDAIETVVGGSLLVKNAVGTAGIVIVCTICIVPIIKIAVIALMLKLSAAATEPIADKRISAMIQEISAVTVNILAMVITVSVMFIICISIMIATTGR